MYVHAADGEAPPDPGEVARKRLVAGLGRCLERGAVGEGVSRGGNRCHPEFAGLVGDGAAQVRELLACGAKIATDAGPDLDLGAEELGGDPLAKQGMTAAISSWGTGEKPRVARSTRWYSSSIPKVNDGSFTRAVFVHFR